MFFLILPTGFSDVSRTGVSVLGGLGLVTRCGFKCIIPYLGMNRRLVVLMGLLPKAYTTGSPGYYEVVVEFLGRMVLWMSGAEVNDYYSFSCRYQIYIDILLDR